MVKEEEQLKTEEKGNLIYIRALCYKLMHKNIDAAVDYVSLMKTFSREEGLKVAKYIFGMILMPLETNRKVKLSQVYSVLENNLEH